MQCNSAIFLVPFLLRILIAIFISFIFDAPVDRIIGFFVLAIADNKGTFVISAEAILKQCTIFFSHLTELMSNGVDRKCIFFFYSN